MSRHAHRPGPDGPGGPDLYAVLGVAPEASSREVTRAYHRLVRNLHPDAGSEPAPDPDALARVLAAYEVLGDRRRRLDYDEQLNGQRTQARPSAVSVPPRRGPGDGVPIPVRIRPAAARRQQSPDPLLRAGPVRMEPPTAAPGRPAPSRPRYRVVAEFGGPWPEDSWLAAVLWRQ